MKSILRGLVKLNMPVEFRKPWMLVVGSSIRVRSQNVFRDFSSGQGCLWGLFGGDGNAAVGAVVGGLIGAAAH